MSTKRDGGSAFPQHGWSNNPDVVERMSGNGGMSLRDWFAGIAALGLYIDGTHTIFRDSFDDQDDFDGKMKAAQSGVAAEAYSFADAMLAERNK